MDSDNIDPSFLLKVADPEEELFEWLDHDVDANVPKLSAADLQSWLKIEERFELDRADHRFSDPDLVSKAVFLKATHDIIERKNRMPIVVRCNPFEKVGSAIFSSRVCVKAANLDWMFQFTEPQDQNGRSLIDDESLGLCYCDVLGDMVTFDQYIEWRKRGRTTKFQLKSMGTGFRSDRSFNLKEPRHLDNFIKYVSNSNVGARLHLLVADYYPDGDETCKKPEGCSTEEFVSHSALTYCLLAISLLRPNGTFIMKLHRSRKLFTVGLIYLMYYCFEKISMVKPLSCRPGQAEGYLICKWKKSGHETDNVRQYLYDVYLKLNEVKDTDLHVLQLVPFDVLEANKTFFKYIYERNVKVTNDIIASYECILRFADVRFSDPRQDDFNKRCLRLWDIDVPKISRRTYTNLAEPVDNWRIKKEPIEAAEPKMSPKNFSGPSSFGNYRSQISKAPVDNWRRSKDEQTTSRNERETENWRIRKE